MSSASPVTPYKSDRRGNRLDAWEFERVGHEWFVLLRGSQEIAMHVVAGCQGAQLVERRRHHSPYWSHRVHLPGPPDAGLRDFLDLLRRLLVLCVRDGIDGAVALDFYSRPGKADQRQLEYTESGTLIRTIKSYASSSPAQIRAAGRELCQMLADVVTTHPWLRSAVAILPVPGHDPRVASPSAGVRIGHTLRRMLDLRLTTVDTRTEFRLSAKNMTSAERAALLDEFVVVDDLSGCTVLVVDDVYHTGHTMAGVARAARTAGAVTVLGIVPVRVMRLDVEPSKARVLDVE